MSDEVTGTDAQRAQPVPGQTVVLSSGEYDDYELNGVYCVARGFDLAGARSAWQDAHPGRTPTWALGVGDFLRFLIGEGYLAPLGDVVQWHWKDAVPGVARSMGVMPFPVYGRVEGAADAAD